MNSEKMEEMHGGVVNSPAKKTKIKISGSTQTGSQFVTPFSSGSPHRSVVPPSGSPRQLSATTKERLFASQRRSPQKTTSYTKTRTSRMSRDRSTIGETMNIIGE